MTKILKNKGFYKDGKKYHKIILKKVLTLVKNGGKLMPSSRGLTSELNIKRAAAIATALSICIKLFQIGLILKK